MLLCQEHVGIEVGRRMDVDDTTAPKTPKVGSTDEHETVTVEPRFRGIGGRCQVWQQAVDFPHRGGYCSHQWRGLQRTNKC
jgi:hypothetical protein